MVRIRVFALLDLPAQERVRGDEALARLSMALDGLLPGELPTEAKAASAAGLPARTLRRRLEAALHRTFRPFRSDLLMNAGRECLLAGWSVKATAIHLGFGRSRSGEGGCSATGGSRAFDRAFFRHHGATPTEWLRRERRRRRRSA